MQLDQDEVLGSHEAGPDTLNILEVVLGDCNEDGTVDANDLACVADLQNLDAVLAETGLIKGDLDASGDVGFSDFLILSGNFSQTGVGYVGGDIDLNDAVEFGDFLTLSGNFGLTGGAGAGGAAVPEPSSHLLFTVLLGLALAMTRRRRR